MFRNTSLPYEIKTLLPYANFEVSARALNAGHLGLQRLEVKALLMALNVPMSGSKPNKVNNHLAVKMWSGHEWALAQYGSTICREWVRRGFRDDLQTQFTEALKYLKKQRKPLPGWLGWDAFHISHQSNLVREDSGHYKKLFPSWVPDNLPYIWPSDELHAGLVMGYTTGIRTLRSLH